MTLRFVWEIDASRYEQRNPEAACRNAVPVSSAVVVCHARRLTDTATGRRGVVQPLARNVHALHARRSAVIPRTLRSRL